MRAALVVIAVLSGVAGSGCKAPGPTRVGPLAPLSPGRSDFPCERGQCRTDFFFAEAPAQLDATGRQALAAAMLAAHTAAKNSATVYSMYVYRRTEVLNETYRADVALLRGSHLDDLMAFARWTHEERDMHLIIERGEAVFDLLTGQAEAPSWEFR